MSDGNMARQRVAVIANMQKMRQRDAGALRGSLAACGVTDLDWVELDEGAHVKQAVERAIASGAKTIVVCGGDGSIRLAAEVLSGTGVALAVVPLGTGNVFVSGLGLPTAIDAVAKSVARGSREAIDTGVCNGAVFNLTAGSGVDVGMVAPSDEEKKRRGFLAYIRAGMLEMLRRRPFEVHVMIDAKPFYEGSSTGVLVGNLGTQVGSIKAFPNASPTDSLLHVAVITAVGPVNWLKLLASVLMRRQRKSSQAQFAEGARVSVRFRRRRRFELDGDILGRTSVLECQVNPRSLVICRPAA